MFIKHISILNLDRAGLNKNPANSSCYSMRVYLSGNPDATWKGHFNSLWRKVFFYKKKKLEFSYGEIKLMLEESDDIQKYIESVKRLVERTNRMVILEQRRRKTENKRRLRINNSIGAKKYKVV